MKKIEKKDLKELFEHIGGVYVGDYAAISRDLNRAVYYLHYLEKDVVRPHDVQDTCYALHQLAECFYWAHSERRIRERDQNRKKLNDLLAILSD